jgi:hypothetical protein
MNAIWIFKNGSTSVECTSFPYAFRAMFNTVRKAIEAGQPTSNLTNQMSIISPMKDIHGNPRVYNYFEAKKMALDQGLLTPEEQINGKEFRRPKR